jgi:hypothetical protein
MLFEVKQNSSVNKMNSTNLAMVFAPCVMRVKDPSENPMREFTDIPKAIAALTTMIDFYQTIFTDELPAIILEKLDTTGPLSSPPSPHVSPSKPQLSTKKQPNSPTKKRDNVESESGASVLKQYLQNGYALPERFKELAEEEGVVEKRTSITETELDNEFGIDSPVRPSTSPVMPRSPVQPRRTTDTPQQNRASVIFKGIADLFTPKKGTANEQKRGSRLSFWVSSSDDNEDTKPMNINRKSQARGSVVSESLPKPTAVPPPKPKGKSKTMSFLVSAFQ